VAYFPIQSAQIKIKSKLKKI